MTVLALWPGTLCGQTSTSTRRKGREEEASYLQLFQCGGTLQITKLRTGWQSAVRAPINMTAGQMWSSSIPKRWPRCCAKAFTPPSRAAHGHLSLALLLPRSPASSKDMACVRPAWGVGWAQLLLPMVDPVNKALLLRWSYLILEIAALVLGLGPEMRR